MNFTKIAGLLALVALIAGCGNALHNGTEMDVSSVVVTGLPTATYPPGTAMVFSYCMNVSSDLWVHSTTTDFTNAKYTASVAANGSLTYTFSPPVIITDPILKFLLIDPGTNWSSMKIDKKVGGKNGGDVILDNNWGGVANPVTVKGVVSGDNVTWTIE